MNTLLAVSALALLASACATEGGTQLAQADCKVAPITTQSAAGVRARPANSLDQRMAEMQLGSSDYRFGNLARNGLAVNNVEDALRNCETR